MQIAGISELKYETCGIQSVYYGMGGGGGFSGVGCHSNQTSQPFGIGFPSKQMTCAILLTTATAMGWTRDEIALGLTVNHSAVSSVCSVCNLRLSRQSLSVEISATPCQPVTNVSEELPPTSGLNRASRLKL
jgi:hypothetical protein